MIRFLYNLLWPIGLLVFLPGYLVKMFRRGGYRRKFGQRFAFYDTDLRNRFRRESSIWLHAVSVGEVTIALKLARIMAQTKPATKFVLSTTTTTGFAFAEKSALPGMEVIYSPLDFWPIMHRALTAIRPERIILVEAEVWPNLAAEAHARNIPLFLVNARLSPRSEGRLKRFRFFVGPTFRFLDLICVQEARDIERWTAIGVSRERIRHTGSIKYDPLERDDRNQPSSATAFQLPGRKSDGLVLFGGSTHRGEERILARVFLQLREQFPTLSLFIAPRHTERAREVKKKLERLSLSVRLCSEADSGGEESPPDCVLLDKTGELRFWYAVATVVFVGKSLAAHGGQNPVEPILAGKPVVFGPHMENFATLAEELVSNGGAVQVADENSLAQTMADLLGNPQQRHDLVRNASTILESHRGATTRTAQLALGL